MGEEYQMQNRVLGLLVMLHVEDLPVEGIIGEIISVREVRLLSNRQNVIFGDLCFIRFTTMPLCFTLDCRV